MERLPRYRIDRNYAWNYDHAPILQQIVESSNLAEPTSQPSMPPGQATDSKKDGSVKLFGFELASPLGIPAGPLLNGAWILYYASLGFDMLTYKTVRSRPRDCYKEPNLLPVQCGQLDGTESSVSVSAAMSGSWAVSFGMPSKHPDVWRSDIKETRASLPNGKLLSVSVVGTEQDGGSIDDLAQDYAICAKWAVESGADCVETNLSCPNVLSTDGQIYQHAQQAATICECVREQIGSTPLIIKIGHFQHVAAAESLVAAVHPFVDAIATTNSIATQVRDSDGALQFDGQKRGICGAATRDASILQTQQLSNIISDLSAKVQLIGVGGVQTADHVRRYLAAGASCVHLATEPMVDPEVGFKIRRELSSPVADRL